MVSPGFGDHIDRGSYLRTVACHGWDALGKLSACTSVSMSIERQMVLAALGCSSNAGHFI